MALELRNTNTNTNNSISVIIYSWDQAPSNYTPQAFTSKPFPSLITGGKDSISCCESNSEMHFQVGSGSEKWPLSASSQLLKAERIPNLYLEKKEREVKDRICGGYNTVTSVGF